MGWLFRRERNPPPPPAPPRRPYVPGQAEWHANWPTQHCRRLDWQRGGRFAEMTLRRAHCPPSKDREPEEAE